jgi:PAS domain S-box-containing protein
LTALTTVAQIATGCVVAVVAIADPVLTPLVLAPAAAIHFAARGSARSTSLLTTVRADRDRLTRVIDGASDGILLLDGTGTIQVWNPAMTALTGIPASRAIGRGVAEVLTDDTRAGDDPVRGRWLVDVAHDGPAQRELEARLHHRDGSWRAVQESHALVYDDRGRCTGDVVVLRDVSRQQELERLRSDFVARVSHELRTPLTPIRGFASVLLRRGEKVDPVQRREALERILERADHLATLVEDLLLVTRVDRGELDDLVHPRPVAVHAIAAAAVVRANAKDPERPIAVHTAPGTPQVLADADRLGQVLDALLDNACRYSPDTSPVEVLVDHPGEDVRIRVVDHGPGIRRADREAVFERFHRLEDPLTMRTSGVGLGLFLARRLTEAMHGTLHVEPADDGIGSTFVCNMPTAEPAATEDQSTA